MTERPTNADLVRDLIEVAELLEVKPDENPFRVQAYRDAAQTLRHLDRPVQDILKKEGTAGLEELPGIGIGLARAIEEAVRTGHLGMLDRLRGEVDPVQLLSTVPGLGDKLARRIYDQLDIHTLTELESAAHDGRLERVAGMGPKRLRTVREALAGYFQQRPRREAAASPSGQPDVAELLDVDREYRQKAAAGALRKIAPRRFNPSGRAWLPILHTQRDERRYTALFSNTARAHELDKTDDWVVIYWDNDNETQWTVVTASSGPLSGQRVVRGRERECRAYYESSRAEADAP